MSTARSGQRRDRARSPQKCVERAGVGHYGDRMFRKILIANRGEIARRINTVAQRMGMKTVAVYSDADEKLPFVREADEAVRLGPAPAKDSYLNVDAILAAVKKTGAEAVHPGYGFISENAGFAKTISE